MGASSADLSEGSGGGLASDPLRQDLSVSPRAGRGSRRPVLGGLSPQLGSHSSAYRPGKRNHVETVCVRDHDSAGSGPAWGGRRHGPRKSQGTRVRREPDEPGDLRGAPTAPETLANTRAGGGHQSRGGGRWGPVLASRAHGQVEGGLNARAASKASPHGAWGGQGARRWLRVRAAGHQPGADAAAQTARGRKSRWEGRAGRRPPSGPFQRPRALGRTLTPLSAGRARARTSHPPSVDVRCSHVTRGGLGPPRPDFTGHSQRRPSTTFLKNKKK